MNVNRRKIAVIVPKYGLVGGGERFVLELTERIAKHPLYEVHVFANQWRAVSDNVVFHKVPMIRFPKFLTTPSFAFFANRQISQMNFDIVHSHERVFKADIVTLHSVPHRFWIRDIRKKKFMSLFDSATVWVEQRMVKSNPRCFLPVSGIAKEKFLEEYPMDPAKISVIHPGVDTDMFKPSDPQVRQAVRQQFGFDESDVVIIFVGMNFEVKGLDSLMAAMSLALSETPSLKLKLWIVGKGNYIKYKSLALKLGLEKYIIFAGVQTQGIEKLYGAADIFCMLSEFDTFGMAVSEAMACGLPVIVSPNVGAKDMVQSGVNGFVVNSRDSKSVSSKLLLLTDSCQRQTMGIAARRTALRHSWDAMAAQILKIYEDIT
jgi:UDP-glucose:(heptosyl)LPS alpha-1,3-glucosyltransferase